MKKTILFGLLACAATTMLAADAKEEVTAAAKKLADQAGYTWKTTVALPEGSRMPSGPTEGKTQKDGLTHVTMTFGENTTELLMKGEKAAVKSQDSGWQSTAELEGSEGRGRWTGMMARNFTLPAAQAAQIAGYAKDLKKDGDAYTGTLTDEGAKALMSFRRRSGGGDGPTISNPSGSAKFWVKDGILTKYEFQVKGSMSFNGNDRDIDRKTTVEIKETGKPKLEVPEDAIKKVS